MVFKTPIILYSIPLIVFVLFWLRLNRKEMTIRFSSLHLVRNAPKTLKTRLFFLPILMRMFVVVLFLVALAGPRKVLEETKIMTEGIDIVLAIDVSGSMAAEDFTLEGKRMNRLEVVKKVVNEFIDARKGDRIGLVAFASQAFTVSPLTNDYAWLKSNLDRIKLGIINDKSTAIGLGLSSALVRFKKSQAKSKVVILLTDGVNNAGKIQPLEAAHAAQALGIKIYTIGAGAQGYAPFPVQDMFGRILYESVLVEIDEKTLKEIANVTHAQYFRATDTESLRQIYKEIDQLEKTKIEQQGFKNYKELFGSVLIGGLCILAFEIILTETYFLKIP